MFAILYRLDAYLGSQTKLFILALLSNYFRCTIFLRVAEYDFSFVPHFTRFHWPNNSYVRIQPIMSRSMNIQSSLLDADVRNF